ncbi:MULTISPECIES: hypothetical protein [Clostridia]|jgi:hypothetical protein|uniref:hypothetical protein n=1 Tax=Clostridia TaxID=186801 RepID=UPI0007407362|nr:hypothetical protein [Clostridium sp. C105KSO13]CUX28007.1 hypothetical protein BN3456_01028 [Clostridium sp. C105KSO13]
MSAFINKIFDIFAQEKQRLPHALIVIFIFSYLFPSESLKIVLIISSKIQLLIPKAFVNLFIKLHLSHADLLALWAFLLVIFAITVVLDFAGQILSGKKELILHQGSQFLMEVNSVIFLSILIYNTINDPGIRIHLNAFDPYAFLVTTSAFIFFFIFFTTYCEGFIMICQNIVASDLSDKIKNILIFILSTVIAAIITTNIHLLLI